MVEDQTISTTKDIKLIGLVDADNNFMWVDVGAPGSCSDAQVWNQCDSVR